MEKTLVVMAAGMGSRFGGLKQIEPVGPNGEFIIDYSVYDAKRAGFTKVVFVIKKELEAANNRKVWLKNGGFITIDKTEALTAIDVNSGKFVGKNNLEETIFLVNEQAAEEIAKQIRLRDIGGIILIDFIDMYTDEHKKRIIDIMKEGTQSDRSRVQIEEFTKLNLLELTRKHICSNYK